ncbi:MAG: serine/threonine-protein kinase [Planctomycetota bacterium]
MRGERLQKAESIFQVLADLPAEQRASVLAEQCAGDDELRSFVERLLARDDAGAGDWLRTPVFPDAAVVPTQSLELPRRIGRYEIIRMIGEGGMGTVYEAQQEQPWRRVALKVIRPGLAAGHLLRRFQQEADVLGQLQHPGIAQIHEAGVAEVTTAAGVGIRQPFFAMELIRGGPLSEHARSRGLGTRARLELVARICDAVQHAHQKGVIHRDLKPGNILVDESGQPKILDFGVARVTDADMQTITMQTGVGQLIGTIPYMSPEQVSAESRELDTRSDVYALGVILYELLSGSLPHDVHDLSIPQAVRKVREEEPRRLGSVDRTLRGEIEIIVARALEKDKARRYQSASDLAADIRRHLRGEAIEAKRDSAFYVLRKTVARYRGLAAASALLFVLLAAFGIVSSIQANRNRQLADGLATALTTSNIERGRLHTRAGYFLGAENLIWREHLTSPQSNHSYWALWELYSQNPSLAAFTGHSLELYDSAFAVDGRTFASCSVDGTVKVWNAETFQPVADLKGPGDATRSVAYSPDGRWIAAAGLDGTVMVWDATTYELLRTLRGHDGPVHAVDFAADGRHLVSGGEDTTVRVWDVATGVCANVLVEHQAPLGAVCFNHGAGILATSSYDGTIKLWKGLAGPSTATLVDPARATVALALSSDGRKLASGNRDRVIKLWNLTDPPSAETLGTPTNGHVRYLAFGPDDETLLSGGWYRIDRWDLATGEHQPIVTYGVTGGSMRPDGRIVVAGFEGGPIRATDISIDAGQIRLGGKSNRGVASVSPNGRVIACGDDTDQVRLWETATGRLLARLPSPTWRWSSAHFHPSGKIIATCGANGVVQVWDLATGTRTYSFEGVHVTTGQSLSFSPDGQLMAVTRPDQTVQLRDVGTGDVLATLPSLGSEVLAARFSSDGRMIATTQRGDTVALWTETGEPLGTLACGYAPWTVGFSPDGRKLAVGGWSYDFQIWDLETRQLEARLGESKSVVWGVAFRPSDMNILATCSGDGSVMLWDLSERRNILTLEPFGGADALSVSFTPDGKTLVAAGFDGSLCVWDLEYYDRHIAGNLEYQIGRFNEELGDSIQAEQLRAWAERVLRRRWPRIGPHAQRHLDSHAPPTDAIGVDPAIIAAWGQRDLGDASRNGEP